MWTYRAPVADMLWPMTQAIDALASWSVWQASASDNSDAGRCTAQWLDAARFGIDWLLPQAQVHWARAARADTALPVVS